MGIGTAIVITSGKGGTGKTATVAGVGACLAAMGHTTLCIDMDVGLRSLDLTLGLSDRALMDFTDVIQGRCNLKRAAVEHPLISNLFLLTAPVTLPAEIGQDDMRALLLRVRRSFDYCLLDCPAGVDAGFSLAVCGADRAIVVCNTDPVSLRDGQAAVAQLRKTDIPLHLVVNRVKPRLMRKLHMDIDDAMDATGLALLGIVPEDEMVPLSGARGISVITAEKNGAARAYYNIAQRIDGRRVPLMRI